LSDCVCARVCVREIKRQTERELTERERVCVRERERKNERERER